MYYYNARYYDPELCRFIQADSVLDGLNRYAYCHNNPIIYTDPTGETAADDEMSAYMRGIGKSEDEINAEIARTNALFSNSNYISAAEVFSQYTKNEIWHAYERLNLMCINFTILDQFSLLGGYGKAEVFFKNEAGTKSFIAHYSVELVKALGLFTSLGEMNTGETEYTAEVPTEYSYLEVAKSFENYFSTFSFSMGSLFIGGGLNITESYFTAEQEQQIDNNSSDSPVEWYGVGQSAIVTQPVSYFVPALGSPYGINIGQIISNYKLLYDE